MCFHIICLVPKCPTRFHLRALQERILNNICSSDIHRQPKRPTEIIFKTSPRLCLTNGTNAYIKCQTTTVLRSALSGNHIIDNSNDGSTSLHFTIKQENFSVNDRFNALHKFRENLSNYKYFHYTYKTCCVWFLFRKMVVIYKCSLDNNLYGRRNYGIFLPPQNVIPKHCSDPPHTSLSLARKWIQLKLEILINPFCRHRTQEVNPHMQPHKQTKQYMHHKKSYRSTTALWIFRLRKASKSENILV